jgi:hypothetical protein
VKRAAGLAAALLVLGGAAPARTAPPRCEAEAAVEPARGFVGQQLHYHLRILRRRDVGTLEWATPLSFPTFRSEWLPGVTGEARVEREGETWLVFVERRALFPAHPGLLRIPGAALRCVSPDGEEIVPIPALEVQVDELPAEGRPGRFGGLLGPIELTAAVTPSRVALGETLRVSVLLRGDTNLWDADSPRAALEAAGVDVFERPPELARDAGRALRLRRYLHYDLVPRRAGVIRLGELRIPYFDPAARRYGEARAQLAPIEVREASAAPALPGLRAEPRPPAPAAPAQPLRRLALALAAAGALAAAATFVWWRRRPAAPASAAQQIERWLAEARAAEARRDREAAAAAGARALRAALRAEAGLSTEEILQRLPAEGPARDAGRLLAEIERARFAGGGPAPAVEAIEASVARLRC